MDNRLAMLSIIVENLGSAEKVNNLLHEFSPYIIGRMGLPYKDRGLSIISVVLDGPPDVISSLSGKMGMLPGVSSKTITAKQAKETK